MENWRVEGRRKGWEGVWSEVQRSTMKGTGLCQVFVLVVRQRSME